LGQAISGAGGIFEIAPIETSFSLRAGLCLSASAWIGTTLVTEGADTYHHYNLLPKTRRPVPRQRGRSSYGGDTDVEVDEEGVLVLPDCRVRPRTVVTARVTLRGEPVPGQLVRSRTASRLYAFSSLPAEAWTDECGVARFEGPLLDHTVMWLDVDRHGCAFQSRDVALSTATADVDIDLVPEAVLEGQVFDPLGRPVRDAEVWAGSMPSTQTDADGPPSRRASEAPRPSGRRLRARRGGSLVRAASQRREHYVAGRGPRYGGCVRDACPRVHAYSSPAPT
jgi:hypothetical protein